MREIEFGGYVINENGEVFVCGKEIKCCKQTKFTKHMGKKIIRAYGKFYFLDRLVYSKFNNIRLEKNHVIIHKDGDIDNCRLDNLKLAFKNGRKKILNKSNGKIYLTHQEAADDLNVSKQCVQSWLKGKYKTSICDVLEYLND